MTDIATMDGGQLLVECLKNFGAKKAFGVPGESYLAVLNAMHDTQGEFDFVLCRQEGGAAYMAAAYGKLTGEPGICMVTRGPGATNASVGVHTAMQDSSPMILLVGQIGTDQRGREAFQEVDYVRTFGDLAKWVVEIDHVDRIPEIISRAWKTAVSGRPGPVVVALPEDMLTTQTNAQALTQPTIIDQLVPGIESLAKFKESMLKCSRPLIVWGGGMDQAASEDMEAFATRHSIPVVTAFRYNDRYNNFSPTYVGEAGVGMPAQVRETIASADKVLALGVRFGEMLTDAYSLFQVPRAEQSIIHVHASDAELGKIYVPDLAIQCGPGAFAAALRDIDLGETWKNWATERRAAFEETLIIPAQESPVDMGVVTAHLQSVLPETAILTNGAGNFAYWPNKVFQYGPGARLLAPQSGSMGYGVPAAIAAKVHEPNTTVVCFAGDGDFQMNSQELSSAKQAGACPIILVLNNSTYGTIRMHQEREYPERISGTTIENPDFVGLAKAYGFYGERVEHTADFAAAFDRAMHSKTGAVLELITSAEAITPRQTITQIRAKAKRG